MPERRVLTRRQAARRASLLADAISLAVLGVIAAFIAFCWLAVDASGGPG